VLLVGQWPRRQRGGQACRLIRLRHHPAGRGGRSPGDRKGSGDDTSIGNRKALHVTHEGSAQAGCLQLALALCAPVRSPGLAARDAYQWPVDVRATRRCGGVATLPQRVGRGEPHCQCQMDKEPDIGRLSKIFCTPAAVVARPCVGARRSDGAVERLNLGVFAPVCTLTVALCSACPCPTRARSLCGGNLAPSVGRGGIPVACAATTSLRRAAGALLRQRARPLWTVQHWSSASTPAPAT